MTTKFCKIEQMLLVIVMLLLATGVGFGQGIVTGSISGTVLDPQGAVVEAPA